ncbi:hypothetical protein XELAEV_18010269mg [Xenopus laevis]|uniref:Ig-like domain-containing protein n=1 Tax=Xenopus laevis TaxID=8355 RepID=A0A974I1S6_XENLA|nr:hypothetical protein XELAEV_18010269mg [Xenopus laevis]
MFHITAGSLLLLCSVSWANVIQPPIMAVSAGMNLTLPCSHESITPTGYIHWYRLHPGQGPQSVISGFKDTVSGFHTMTFTKDRKSSELHIQSIKPEDGGVYLCALSDTAMQPNVLSVQYVYAV